LDDYIAIFGCPSLLQSLGDTIFQLAMVENPGFAAGISTLCCSTGGITTSGFGGHIAISGCRAML